MLVWKDNFAICSGSINIKMVSWQLFPVEVETTAGTEVPDLTSQVAAKARDVGVSRGYGHDRRLGDGIGLPVRAAFLQPSLSIPCDRGRLPSGAWQQRVPPDLADRPRLRRMRGQVLAFQAADG